MSSTEYTSFRKRLYMEELLNTISHGIGTIAAIIGFILLIIYATYSPHQWAIFSSFFYGLSLIAAYLSSTIYHAVNDIQLKRRLLTLDQACIFLLIAGSYTPFLLIAFGGVFGWVFFGIQWGTAILGICLKIYDQEIFDKISLFIYAIMGWVAIFYIYDLYLILPETAFYLVVGGGLAYTIGIYFYLLDAHVHYAHFVWHLFVILGSLLHYLAIFFYVI